MSRSPFRGAERLTLSSIQSEVGNLVERLKRFGAAAFEGQEFTPVVDVQEEPNRYVVTAELPGVAAETLDVTVGGATVTISGDKLRPVAATEPGVAEYPQLVQGERRYGRFSRAVPLPGSVQTEHVDAVLANGVLTLSLLKLAGPKPVEVRVEVKASTNSAPDPCG